MITYNEINDDKSMLINDVEQNQAFPKKKQSKENEKRTINDPLNKTFRIPFVLKIKNSNIEEKERDTIPNENEFFERDEGPRQLLPHHNNMKCSIDAAAKTKTSLWRINKEQKWLIVYVFLPTFLFKVCERSTIPVIPEFVKSTLHGDDLDIGIVVACVGFGKLLGNLPAGWYVGTMGSYYGIVLSCCVCSAAWFTVVFLCHSSITIMTATCLMEGIGLSIWQLSRQNLLTLGYNSNNRGRIQAFTGGIVRMASVIGPAIGGYVVQHLGTIRTPFTIKATIMACSAVFFGIIQSRFKIIHDEENEEEGGKRTERSSLIETKEVNRNNGKQNYHTMTQQHHGTTTTSGGGNNYTDTITAFDKQQRKQSYDSYASIIYDNGTLLFSISFFVLMMPVARETRLVLFPLKAMELGYNPNMIGILTSITFFIDSSLFPVAGHLMDTYGRKYSGIPAALFLGLSYFITPILLPSNRTSSGNTLKTFLVLTLSSCIGGIGSGLSCGVMNAIGSDLAAYASSGRKKQNAAMFLALYRMIADTGIFLGPLVAGFLSSGLSLDSAFYTISITTFLAAIWLALIMPETSNLHRNIV